MTSGADSAAQSHAKVAEMQRQRRLTFTLALRSLGTLVFYVLPVAVARLINEGNG